MAARLIAAQGKMIYRVKRVQRQGHYRWTLQAASVNGGPWVQVTNMEGKVPLYFHRPDAQKVADELQAKGGDTAHN